MGGFRGLFRSPWEAVNLVSCDDNIISLLTNLLLLLFMIIIIIIK